jgi:hypothetical protein
MDNFSTMDLESIFYTNQDRLISKWNCYFSVYERYFNKYRNKPLVMLEIGVAHGGSLQMWKKYFGENLIIYGLDINPRCKSLEEKNIQIYIGSQSDRKFLRWLKTQIPKIDILLDDGGHSMKQQIVTFEELFDHIKEDGVYICEDCHTSYWPSYGGGYLRKGTYIEYAKRLIDKLNAWHTRRLPVDNFTNSAKSVCFYDSMVVIEKNPIKAPECIDRGKPSFEEDNETGQSKSNGFLRMIDFVLYAFKLPSLFR